MRRAVVESRVPHVLGGSQRDSEHTTPIENCDRSQTCAMPRCAMPRVTSRHTRVTV